MSEPTVIRDVKHVRQFMFAGKATLTLKSEASGDHYTLKINKMKDKQGLFFVSLLSSANQYTYLGMIVGTVPMFKLTAKSKMSEDSTPVRAVKYFLNHLVEHNQIAPKLEVRHEGCCGRCGRELTHPDSIDRGIGPECIKHVS